MRLPDLHRRALPGQRSCACAQVCTSLQRATTAAEHSVQTHTVERSVLDIRLWQQIGMACVSRCYDDLQRGALNRRTDLRIVHQPRAEALHLLVGGHRAERDLAETLPWTE